MFLVGGLAHAAPNDGFPESRAEIEARELGSVVSKNEDTGGFTIFGQSIGGAKQKEQQTKPADSTQGDTHILPVLVNQDLWQASLEEVQFMPLLVSDSSGGAISTDWYEDPKFKNERYKFNILIKSSKLKTDSLNVVAFKQEFKDDRWIDVKPNPAIASKMKKSILAKAKQSQALEEGTK
jgi:hypothetical protein